MTRGARVDGGGGMTVGKPSRGRFSNHHLYTPPAQMVRQAHHERVLPCNERGSAGERDRLSQVAHDVPLFFGDGLNGEAVAAFENAHVRELRHLF